MASQASVCKTSNMMTTETNVGKNNVDSQYFLLFLTPSFTTQHGPLTFLAKTKGETKSFSSYKKHSKKKDELKREYDCLLLDQIQACFD